MDLMTHILEIDGYVDPSDEVQIVEAYRCGRTEEVNKVAGVLGYRTWWTFNEKTILHLVKLIYGEGPERAKPIEIIAVEWK